MRKMIIKLLNNKYIIIIHIFFTFYVPPWVRLPQVEYHWIRVRKKVAATYLKIIYVMIYWHTIFKMAKSNFVHLELIKSRFEQMTFDRSMTRGKMISTLVKHRFVRTENEQSRRSDYTFLLIFSFKKFTFYIVFTSLLIKRNLDKFEDKWSLYSHIWNLIAYVTRIPSTEVFKF
jgi:hypothetical protein